MRIVFLGTPSFAVPSLEALVAARHNVRAVFTQPDRPKGRGNQLAESPVKTAAKALHLPVHQPERVRRPEAVELLRSLDAELMVVVGYGQIIPQTIIDLPKHGILNVHASLLPRYRGAAPIQWAIANGETETGVTIMEIDAGLDTGDMLAKRAARIGPDEIAPDLAARLAADGAGLLISTIDAIQWHEVRREKQDDSQATLAPILKKEDGLVDWRRSASEVYNRWRGFNPWPGAVTEFRGQSLLLTKMKLSDAGENRGSAPGSMMTDRKTLTIVCGDGCGLELLEVQPAGKKRMTADAFLNGYRPAAGELLGPISGSESAPGGRG